MGEQGGVGGYNGGGHGGRSFRGGGAGAGGGCSSISIRGVVVVVAAGGGGAGSTDYCCSDGGAAGGAAGYDGIFPGDHTPWPLSDPALGRPTPVISRRRYTSSNCNLTQTLSTCISEWDVLPRSLPVGQLNLDYGMTPQGNYSAWAMAGAGGSATAGGAPGMTGSFTISNSGNQLVAYGDGLTNVYTLINGLIPVASPGQSLVGGKGADGHDAGGGGGAGLFGGGGGGAGIDGAGGGGGSSYFDAALAEATTSLYSAAAINVSEAIVGQPLALLMNDTSATLAWHYDSNKASAWGKLQQYVIEYSVGSDSEDFMDFAVVPAPPPSANPLVNMQYTVSGLSPASSYRFRVRCEFSKDVPRVSPAVTLVTLAPAIDYWEGIVPRRYARATLGGGYSDPVIERPHIDFANGSYISSALSSVHASDSPTGTIPSQPSGRRGHSFTLVDGLVYMVGGRTNGYPCSSIYKDYSDIRTSIPLADVIPCVSLAGEVSEVWTLDVRTYEWQLLTLPTDLPPREQHTAFELDGDIFVFGGRLFNFSATSVGDVVYGDMWRLHVQHNVSLVLNGTTALPAAIPDNSRLFDGTNESISTSDYNARIGLCIEEVRVLVTFRHPCAEQLRISLLGPGPTSGSPNWHPSQSSLEVILFNQRSSNGTGCVNGLQSFEFTDKALMTTLDCCPQVYDGQYRPEGRLDEFIGASPHSQWQLIVQDMQQDDFSGTLESWSLEIVAAPCSKSYSWSHIPMAQGLSPSARYQARSVSVNGSAFIFGGIDANGAEMSDLWRFDLSTAAWTQLLPGGFRLSLTDLAYGMTVVLTPSGLIELGGYSASFVYGDSYIPEDTAVVVDLSSGQRVVKQELRNTSLPLPAPRYLSAAVFIPSSAVIWRTNFSPTHLNDKTLASSRVNYAGSLMDSLLVFGGDDGVSGLSVDGASGGLLSDAWMLRLPAASTPLGRNEQAISQDASCAWRARSTDRGGCFQGTNGSVCVLKELLLAAWCAGKYQNL
jgi:subtilisin-like proprotein convertase family protein